MTDSQKGDGGPDDVLAPDGTFATSWLRGRPPVPLPAGGRIDAMLARRITAACRTVGATHVLATPPSARPHGPLEGAPLRPPLLLRTPDAQGAVLFPAAGYALIAGSAAFMASAVAEGADAARAAFARYARALSSRHPHLRDVAAAHPPRHPSRSRLDAVPPSTATARHIALLEAFAEGTCAAPEFARGWWSARAASRTEDQRVHGALARLFDEVFMLLEQYAPDPALAEPEDLDDTALRTAVTTAWTSFRTPPPAND
ncbi:MULTISPECIES: colicin immunity domain-containing protein [Streptomyces]|uniref:Colicin immunity domain-containing protein n=2 Tax=Streptomyces TaxID=1883 RepID=A0ABU4K0V9_9ACTN|nr:colicin immunity domain-containing protein [Streptomyces roseolus]MDX2291169.1 colicin immunity domain-containing protein [Streptomyces roseolus]